jgi:filamentous hemagglutinin family protein
MNASVQLIAKSFFCIIALACFANATRAGNVASDGSLHSIVTHTGNNFLVTQGTIVGNNQFHSLATLNLDKGETAEFTGPANIQNVLTRITGGPSNIDGTIQCDIAGANFYLVNPAGVVFGPDASLNVGGSFAVTTADVVHLVDGGKFRADLAANSVLTTAPAAAFGFLHANPASITVQGQITPASGASLTVVGGDVSIIGGQIKATGSGSVAVVSVASPGNIQLATPPTVDSSTSLGTVSVTAGGAITSDSSSGGVDGGPVSVTAGTILLSGNALGGQLSKISSVAGTGNAGVVTVSASGAVTVSNGAQISATTFGISSGGNINVSAGTLSILNGAEITTHTFGAGTAGNIAISVATALMLEGPPVPFEKTIDAGAGFYYGSSPGTGKGGDIAVSAGSLSLTNGAALSTDTYGPGNAGNISISVTGNITLDLAGLSASSFDGSYTSADDGAAGHISLTAGSLNMAQGASIAAQEFFKASTGSSFVRINAGSIQILGSDIISSGGTAAQIIIHGQGIDIENSTVRADFGSATVSIDINASGQLTMVSTQVLTDSSGNTGSIDLSGHDVAVTGTNISTSNFSGPSANLTISSEGMLTFSNSTGSTQSGSIMFTGPDVTIGQGSSLSSMANNAGSGNIFISALHSLTVDGSSRISTLSGYSGAAGNITITTGSMTMQNQAQITTENDDAVIGGDITISTSSLTLSNATVSAKTNVGNGGNILIQPVTSGGPMEFTATGDSVGGGTAGMGNAGNIQIIGHDVSLSRTTLMESSQSGGNAGNIGIIAVNLTLDAASLKADADALTTPQGLPGNVMVTANQIGVIADTILSVTAPYGTAPGMLSVNTATATLGGVPAQFVSSSSGAGFFEQISHATGIAAADDSLGSLVTHSGNNFLVTQGIVIGNNLFHSLSTLNLERGETAEFAGDPNITSILVRVTGGPSNIDGTIRCDIPGASFYLINPAGVVFGPHASLYLGSSFAVTTADVIHLADGGKFMANTSGNSQLSNAAPSAFEFLFPNPAGVTINNSTLTVGTGKVVDIISGPIAIDGATINAPSGQIRTVAVGSSGTVTVSPVDPNAVVQMASFSAMGDVNIQNNSMLNVDGATGGGVTVVGSSLEMTDSQMAVQTSGDSSVLSPGVNINVSGACDMNASSINQSGYGIQSGRFVSIFAGELSLTNSSIAAPEIYTPYQTAVSINVNGPMSMNTAQIRNPDDSIGNVNINALTLNMENSVINGGVAPVPNDYQIPSGMALQNITLNIRQDMSVTNSQLLMDDQYVSSATYGGAINVYSGSFELVNSTMRTTGSSIGGPISISVPNGNIVIGKSTVDTSAGGYAGNFHSSAPIGFDANSMVIQNNSFVNVGQIQVKLKDDLAIYNSQVQTLGGPITISASSLELINAGRLNADGFNDGFVATSGAVTIAIGSLTIEGIAPQPTSSVEFQSGIFSNLSEGQGGIGGMVKVTVTGSAIIEHNGMISSSNSADGSGGSVELDVANKLTITGGTIESADQGPGGPPFGNAGTVTVTARDIFISNGGQISALTTNAGNAGTINITAKRGITIDGAGSQTVTGILSTSTGVDGYFSGESGNAGDIFVHSEFLRLLNAGQISSDNSAIYGANAGNIVITSGSVQMTNGADISSSVSEGVSGDNFGLNSPSAGFITISSTSGNLIVEDHSTIAVSAQYQDNFPKDQFSPNGGGITLTAAGGIEILSESLVDAHAQGDNGGKVTLLGGPLLYIRDSVVTAQAGGNGESIVLDPGLVVLDHSIINGLSNGTPTKVQIIGDLLSQNSQILTDTQQTFPSVDISAALIGLPQPLVGGQIQLAPTCAQMTSGDISSFVITGHGGLPIEPGGWLPIDPLFKLDNK